MAVLGIKMFHKLKLNLFNLVPFGGAHGVSCRLRRNSMIEYGVLSHPYNLEAEKYYIYTPGS